MLTINDYYDFDYIEKNITKILSHFYSCGIDECFAYLVFNLVDVCNQFEIKAKSFVLKKNFVIVKFHNQAMSIHVWVEGEIDYILVLTPYDFIIFPSQTKKGV